MTTPAAIARTVEAAFKPLAEPAVYRIANTFTPRVATTAPAGSTSATLNTLPAGFSPKAGDTFVWSSTGTTHTITADATPAGGSVGVTFTPALTVPLTAGASLTVNRTVDHPVRAVVVQVDGYSLMSGIYAGGDFRARILDLPPGVEPSGSGTHRILWNGKTLTVRSGIGADPSRTVWIVQAR